MNCKHCKAEWTPPASVSLTSCPFCQKPLIEVGDVGDKSKPDRILLEVTQRFGISILGDKRLSSILKDFMPHVERKYQKIFSQAVADGIGLKLLELETEDAAIRTAKIHTLKDGFKNNNGFNNTADYVIDCFLFSLGWIDVVEEKDTAIDESAANIIQSQLEEAMMNGCLSTDETALLFSLGFKLKLSENEIVSIIDDEIKKREFTPAAAIDKTIKNQKDILCSCDWHIPELELLDEGEPNDSYPYFKIGKQIWMKENLNVDRFRNGDLIPEIKTIKEWEQAGEKGKPAWCYYKNDPENGKKYGKLYNWYAVNDPRGLAPEGWHVSSDKEWTQLSDYLGGKDVAGIKPKSHTGWDDKGNGTDTYGFSALPGGSRGNNGYFSGARIYGIWWSATEYSSTYAWRRYLHYFNCDLVRYHSTKDYGFSVRCLRDIVDLTI